MGIFASILAYLRRNYLALAALMIALGGTAYAASEIRGRDVVSGSLKSKHLKDDTVRGVDVRHDSLKGKHIDEATLGATSQISSAIVFDFESGPPQIDKASGFSAVFRTGVGSYNLELEPDAQVCSNTADFITVSGDLPAAAGSASPEEPDANVLPIVLRDGDGKRFDPSLDTGVLGFSVISTCPS